MFAIAEALQCGTVDELSERMSVSEQREWKKYFEIKSKEQEKRMKKAKAKRSKGRPARRRR